VGIDLWFDGILLARAVGICTRHVRRWRVHACIPGTSGVDIVSDSCPPTPLALGEKKEKKDRPIITMETEQEETDIKTDGRQKMMRLSGKRFCNETLLRTCSRYGTSKKNTGRRIAG
jgi:hypothetical protein